MESARRRRITDAEEAAYTTLEDARKEAARIKDQAREQGRQTGLSEFKKILAETKEDVKQKLARARQWAENFREEHHSQIDSAVD